MLVAVEITRRRGESSPSGIPAAPSDPEESLSELRVLAESAGAEIVESILQQRSSYDQSTLIGAGKVEEVKSLIEAMKVDLVVFDQDLGGSQQRNLEKAFGCKVIDRTQLILDIFAHRARTREGQLQVELAQLNYLLPRLTGHGAAMSRLGGGIGTRGPGETKLETDRRRIHRRIKRLEEDLESVRGSRGVQRRLRQAVPLQTLALVGYTNAGKSTLFNRLTAAGVLSDARMFATLDPTVRQTVLPSRRRVLLSDTVGFIRRLPTTLVKAFRATLEEVTEASLLLHVVDAASPAASEHCAHVRSVLAEIGAGEAPQLLVLNKADAFASLRDEELLALARRLSGEAAGSPVALVSARTGEGMETLLSEIDRLLPHDAIKRVEYVFPHAAGSEAHLLHEYAVVLEERFGEDGREVVADVPDSLRRRLRRYELHRR